MKQLLVIGDSHTRSFSYHKAIIPIFLGPGKDHCFSNDKSYTKLSKKLQIILNKIKKQPQTILFVFGEPDIRFFTEGHFENKIINNKNYLALEAVAKKYINLLKQLQANTNHTFIIFNAVPKDDIIYNKNATYYNNYIEKLALKNNFLFVNIWNYITKNSLLIKKYNADFVHCNEKITPFVLQELRNILNFNISTYKNNFYWYYKYNFNIEKNIFSIWGDFPKEQLYLPENYNRYWNLLHSHTQLIEDYIREIKLVVATVYSHKKKPSMLVLDAKEGLFIYRFPEEILNNLVALDRNIDRSQKSIFLSDILNLSTYVQYKKEYFDKDITKKLFDIVINLEIFNYTTEYRANMYRNIYKITKEFAIILSKKYYEDKQMLEKIGFKYIYKIFPTITLRNDFDTIHLITVFKKSPNYTIQIKFFCNKIKFFFRYIRYFIYNFFKYN